MDGFPSIEKFRRPILASFGQKVEEIPDRREEVYASVVWAAIWSGVKRGFAGIEMMYLAVRFAAEYAEARMLSSVTFNVQIRVEARLAAR